MAEFVKIKNPRKPGESLVLARDEFDPTVHELFEPAKQELEQAPAPTDAIAEPDPEPKAKPKARAKSPKKRR